MDFPVSNPREWADKVLSDDEKNELYEEITLAVGGLLDGETDWLANLANVSSLLFERLPCVNWVGFYRLVNGQLVLGPFQGRLACTRIAIGRGVCGTAFQEGKTRVVEDVHEFPGHIACDPVSRSEIVVPLVVRGAPWGLLDIDSPKLKTFNEVDAFWLERLVNRLSERSLW